MKIRLSECCNSIPWNDTNMCAECNQAAKFYLDSWKENKEDPADRDDRLYHEEQDHIAMKKSKEIK